MYSRHTQMMKENVSDARKCWYLEVIAVSPEVQGQGLGRQMMTWLQNLTKEGEFIILECTAVGNVPVYERLGFSIVEVVQLTHEERTTKEWVMTWSTNGDK